MDNPFPTLPIWQTAIAKLMQFNKIRTAQGFAHRGNDGRYGCTPHVGDTVWYSTPADALLNLGRLAIAAS